MEHTAMLFREGTMSDIKKRAALLIVSLIVFYSIAFSAPFQDQGDDVVIGWPRPV